MKRIAIIGSPGAGKSTFARRLGEITGIEVFHLDRLFWKPGWVETPRPDWIALQQRLVQNESWIIDGNYGATMDIRIQAADTVIFLDFPRRVCLWRVTKRVLRYRGQTRPDMGEGCLEKIDFEFLRYIWGFRKREQEKILQLLQEAQRQGKQVIRLGTSKQVESFLATLRCILSKPMEETCSSGNWCPTVDLRNATFKRGLSDWRYGLKSDLVHSFSGSRLRRGDDEAMLEDEITVGTIVWGGLLCNIGYKSTRLQNGIHKTCSPSVHC